MVLMDGCCKGAAARRGFLYGGGAPKQFAAAVLQTSLQLQQVAHNFEHPTDASPNDHQIFLLSHFTRIPEDRQHPPYVHTHPARPRSLPAARRFPPTPAARLAVLPRPERREPGQTASDAHPSRYLRQGGALEMKIVKPRRQVRGRPPSGLPGAARSQGRSQVPTSLGVSRSIQTDFRGDLSALATSI